MSILLINANSVQIPLADQSVDCVVTSPPYYSLRDYNADGQLGLESTPEEYISNLVQVFREVHRVLRDDGTLWVVIGDSYSGSGGAHKSTHANPGISKSSSRDGVTLSGRHYTSIPPKNLIGIPWRLAFALQADGWNLRSEIIWEKPNTMPESVTDRPTKSHEQVFLLTKQLKYYYNIDAIREPHTTQDARKGRIEAYRSGVVKHDKAVGRIGNLAYTDPLHTKAYNPKGRNKRSVWSIHTQPYGGGHFAAYPEELVEPCIKAGCKEGGIVFDPFLGSGTTLLVARRLGRHGVGVDISLDYLTKEARVRLQLDKLYEWKNGINGNKNVDDLPLFGNSKRSDNV